MKFLLSLCVLFLSLQIAFACKCVQRPVEELTQAASYIFRGKVVDIWESEQEIVFSVAVEDTCKGDFAAREQVKITTKKDSCGILGLEQEQVYNFFADENLGIQSCMWDGSASWETIKMHCHEKPCICTKEWAPVVGTDGMTYGNKCMAACAGVEAEYEGQSEDPEEDPEDQDYPEDQNYPEDTEECFCAEIFSPVCGKDGMTYVNKCFARCAGVQVAHRGECEDPESPCRWKEEVEEECPLRRYTKRYTKHRHCRRYRKYGKLRKYRRGKSCGYHAKHGHHDKHGSCPLRHRD